MVRAANHRNVNRPHNHSEDDLISDACVSVSPREKRPASGRNGRGEPSAAAVGAASTPPLRKVAKVQSILPPPNSGLAGGLGAQFKKLGGLEGPKPLMQLTPRRLPSLSPRRTDDLATKPLSAVDDSERLEGGNSKNGLEVETDDTQYGDEAVSEEAVRKVEDNEPGQNAGADDDATESTGEDCGSRPLVWKVPSCDNVPAAGHGVDPKFMTQQTFRSRASDDRPELAEQLKAMGQVCTPLCSPRRLNRRRQKRAQKRIRPDLQDQAKPSLSLLHPPCVVSGAVYSVLKEQYTRLYQQNLRELYNKQLEKEVNIERFSRTEPSSKAWGNQLRQARNGGRREMASYRARGGVTGKFSNVCCDEDDPADDGVGSLVV